MYNKKLIVLDLNGVLIYRKKSIIFTPRPYTKNFLDYLFESNKYEVMIWSSAIPKNVEYIVNNVFKEYQNKILLKWNRSNFGLSAKDYKNNCITIKDLQLVWNLDILQKKYDKSITIIIDDDKIKCQKQPNNHLHINSFQKVDNDKELLYVIDYLKNIEKSMKDIDVYINEYPYRKWILLQQINDTSTLIENIKI